MRDRILIILILFFAATYAYLNVNKLEYVYEKTFVSPQKYLYLDQSHVVRIEVTYDNKLVRESLIDQSVVTQDGRPTMFVYLPENFDLAAMNVKVDSIKALHLEQLDPAIAYTDAPVGRVYFIRANHTKNMMDIVSINDLRVSQPWY